MGFYKYGKDGKPVKTAKYSLDCQKAIAEGEEIRVEQSHKSEVDINNIIRRHGIDLTQKVQNLTQFVFDDVTTNDFQEMMNQLIKAKETFSHVPKEIRARFDNDPAAFMDFCMNQDNREQLREWNMLEPEPGPAEPVPVIVQNPPETPPAEPAAG